MKQDSKPVRHAAWLFLAAPAFLATPAHAQEAAPQAVTPPPPVIRTVPPATSTSEASAPAATPVVRGADPASSTRIAPGAADVVDDARIAAQAERRPEARRETRRTATVTRTAATRATAPIAAAAPAATTAAAPAPAQTAPTPVETAAAPAAQPTTPTPMPTPAEPTAAATETTTTQAADDTGGAPLWPLAAIVALIVAVGAFFFLRGRKAEAEEDAVYYEEPAYAEPVAVAAVAPVAAPVAAAVTMTPQHDEPVAAGLAEEPTVSEAPAEDVAALTGGTPAVQDRPWLELAMRPVRAGTSADEALVEIELTVANSGSVAAEDVRVTTFMLTDANASEMERVLVDAPADAAIDPVRIEPGEGTRIDATLAALKADLGTEGRFTPVVVADARYRLPDGSEGRTSASFVVGVSDTDGGTLIPIDLADRVMREDVEARLHGEPEHA